MTTYIKEEEKIIVDDYHKLIYYMYGASKVMSESFRFFSKLANATKNRELINRTIRLGNGISAMDMAFSNFFEYYKPKDKRVANEFVEIFIERIKLVIIPLVRMPLADQNSFVNIISSYFQGEIGEVKEHIFESIAYTDEPETIEGLSLIQRYCPNMSAEQKEEFAKDLTRWSDIRNSLKK